jgi:hypothetical protein
MRKPSKTQLKRKPPVKQELVSPDAARDFLRQSAEMGKWSTAYAQKVLGIEPTAAKQALSLLQTTGFIERAPGSNSEWQTTMAARQALKISSAKPIARQTAEDKLDEFLNRADQVGNDPHYLYKVQKVVLFGPYLDPKAKVKDIDLAVELVPKEKNAARHEQAMRKRSEETRKRFKNQKAKLDWGRAEVLDFLKSRSRAITLHPLEDWVLRQPHKVVYENEL